MDKKSKKILMHYMDDTKRKLLSFEEIAYAKEHGAILEDLSISHEEAIRILTQSLKCISLSDAANSFLYSLSTRDMEYRYILASYVYAVSWLMFDGGRTDKVPSRLDRTFYNWVKYQGGGIWGGIGKPIFYLNEFAHMDKQTPTSTDKNILKEIISRWSAEFAYILVRHFKALARLVILLTVEADVIVLRHLNVLRGAFVVAVADVVR